MSVQKLTRDINAIINEISTHQGIINDLKSYMSKLVLERHVLNNGIIVGQYVQTPRCKNIWVDNYITPVPVNGFVTNILVAETDRIYADVKMDDNDEIMRFPCSDLFKINIKKKATK